MCDSIDYYIVWYIVLYVVIFFTINMSDKYVVLYTMLGSL